jgi:hypothetical protein
VGGWRWPTVVKSQALIFRDPRRFSASLAGLLWKDILLQKGIIVGRWEFMKNNAITVMICMVVGGLVVAGEVMVMLKD